MVTFPRRLNILQELPPSSVMYPPVMSQCTKTSFESRGLMVGAIMVPPPPGPTICHRLNRGA